MSEIHDRMPVILPMDDVPAWLEEDNASLDDAAKLMWPSREKLTMAPVDQRMSNVKNWQEEFCRPIQL